MGRPTCITVTIFMCRPTYNHVLEKNQSKAIILWVRPTCSFIWLSLHSDREQVDKLHSSKLRKQNNYMHWILIKIISEID